MKNSPVKSNLELIFRKKSWFLKYLNKDIKELSKMIDINPDLKYIRGGVNGMNRKMENRKALK